jgi:hypothetical protein
MNKTTKIILFGSGGDLRKLIKDTDVSNQFDDVDVDMMEDTFKEGLTKNIITQQELDKYFTILKSIGGEKNIKKEDEKFLMEFTKKLKPIKKQKSSLEKIDGNNAVFKLYGEGNPVLFDVSKGQPLQLANKFKEFKIVKEDGSKDYTLRFTKGDVTYNSWMVDKATNKNHSKFELHISPMFS